MTKNLHLGDYAQLWCQRVAWTVGHSKNGQSPTIVAPSLKVRHLTSSSSSLAHSENKVCDSRI